MDTQKNKNIYYVVGFVVLVLVLTLALTKGQKDKVVMIDPVPEQLPVQAKYINSSENIIKVELPFPGAVTGKEFTVMGQARGSWYFEASFPVKVLDKDGKVLFAAPAQAQGEWMTEDFVPFKAQIKIPASYTGPATLVLEKDNPSGESANEASISFPITIEY